MSLFAKYRIAAEGAGTVKHCGRVERLVGLLIESRGPAAQIGELCRIELDSDRRPGQTVLAEVVGFADKKMQLMPYGEIGSLKPGARVRALGRCFCLPASAKLLGRTIDSLGRPIDNLGHIQAADWLPVDAASPPALDRRPITEVLATGVKAIDGFTPIGKGQRLGIFSGSGVGKSTLLGMIARHASADVNIVAMIGERGREVREFIEGELGAEGLKRSIIVVAPADSSPLARVRGAYTATTLAEYFRDQGADVMLLLDSLTRFARAQREIGLAIGEPPASRGYTPSVFEQMPRLLERCGSTKQGTITGFYSILVEGDDMDEPISDNARGILDGHLELSRQIAQSGHYPAIDILASLSRLANKISDAESQKAARVLRELLAAYRESEDLIKVGAYAPGSNQLVDQAIDKLPALNAFLRQPIDQKSDYADTVATLTDLAGLNREPVVEDDIFGENTLNEAI